MDWLPFLRRGLTGFWLAVALAACGGANTDIDTLSSARFLASDEAKPPAESAPWSEQKLPDDWDVSRPGKSGFAWYRFEVAAPKLGDHDYGFYLTATASNAQLFVNGALAAQAGDLKGEAPQRWEAVQFFAVPRTLLVEGGNAIDLRIYRSPGRPGGIGLALFGPYESIYQRSLRDQFAHTIGPAAASLSILVLGVFILVLWFRARKDRDYLIFAAATILWGLHTVVTLLPREPLPPPHFQVWWNAVYVLWVVLLCVFSVRFTGARWPRYERAAVLYALAIIPALYLAAAFGALNAAAAAARFGGIVAAIVALYAVVGNALRTRDAQSWMLLATGAAAAIFGLHDWISAQDPDNLRPVYLVPYVALFFIALIGWIMIDRFVKTLREYEALNLELERRVAEKSRALEIEVARQGEARKQAEAANLAKSRFLAAASHDLRQPLHALGLFASALDERTQDRAGGELTARINQSIAALESLFNEVLDVSRLDAGAVSANPRPVLLQPLFDRIASDLATNAEEKNLALRFVPTARAVRTDPVLLERILRNLVSNAIRYTETGSILVGVRPRAGRLALEVRDSGIGIPKEHQASIFDEFYQVENRERDRRKGLGLGLSIVKRLCDLMGHQLTLASCPGRGTTFRIALEAATALPEDATQAAPPAQAALQGARIVVIDDERDVRDSMESLLRAWGCDVRAHSSAAEALAARQPGTPAPALLIVDYRLPDGATGLDAARALRDAWGGDLAVLLISGESSAPELARIRDSGLQLLHKPVPPAKLRSLILHLLSG